MTALMVMPVASLPPGSGVELQRWPLDDRTQLRGLRAALHHAVTDELRPGAGDALRDTMALVVTGLASNALRHARPPIVVRLSRGELHNGGGEEGAVGALAQQPV